MRKKIYLVELYDDDGERIAVSAFTDRSSAKRRVRIIAAGDKKFEGQFTINAVHVYGPEEKKK